MKKYIIFIFLFSLFNTHHAQTQITLSEIMFNPTTNDNYYEFVEVYNLSTIDSIDLTGWKISDGTDFDHIIAADDKITIDPNQFGIILDPGYFDYERIYDQLIPSEALLLTIDNSTFGSGGLSNRTPETVYLINADDDTISVYTYSLGNSDGFSDEKINLSGSNTQDNWADCKTLHGSPGAMNSVSPFDFDLIINILFKPEVPKPNSDVIIYGFIKNIGLKPASEFNVIFYEDTNRDSIPGEDEMIGSPIIVSETVPSDDYIEVTFNWKNVMSGAHIVLAKVDFRTDQNTVNNIDIKILAVSFQKLDMIINEVMFQPSSPKPEWIELYNATTSIIDLIDWKISDKNILTKNTITKSSMFIDPKSFIVVCKDSSIRQYYPNINVLIIQPQEWSALNNDFDAVVLYDLTNTTIDSMVYVNAWNSKIDVSLERYEYFWSSIDSSNWAPSIDPIGASPGVENSIAPKSFDLAIQNLYFDTEKPNPGESVTIIANVANVGRNAISDFVIKFYNDVNKDSILDASEQIGKSITYPEFLQQYEEVEIATRWDNIPSGVQYVYAIISLSNDLNPFNNKKMARLNVNFTSQSLIINEVMYSPFSGQAEWIELYNRSHTKINFQDWEISDSDTGSVIKLCTTPFDIAPESFLVISSDTLVIELFPELPSPIIITSKFPSLKDDYDSIYLYDINKKIIDYVNYQSSWGGGQGISLERINPEIASNDNSNWSSCVYLEGGTPGSRNSVFIQVVPSATAITAVPNPFSPDADGFNDVTIINYQLPLTTAIFNLKIYDVRGHLVRYLCNNKPSGAQGSVIWDGKDDDGSLCRIGIYIIYLEALNAARGVIVSHKKTVVLAAKL